LVQPETSLAEHEPAGKRCPDEIGAAPDKLTWEFGLRRSYVAAA